MIWILSELKWKLWDIKIESDMLVSNKVCNISYACYMLLYMQCVNGWIVGKLIVYMHGWLDDANQIEWNSKNSTLVVEKQYGWKKNIVRIKHNADYSCYVSKRILWLFFFFSTKRSIWWFWLWFHFQIEIHFEMHDKNNC